jgi:ParE toxin of type II toxin-antitoxin system, parDE
MRYRLSIAAQVQEQLDQAADWYRQTSGFSEIGDEWAAGIVAAIESLRTDPTRHPLAREAPRLGVELRELHYGSGKRRTHRALFIIREDVVEVLAVRHPAQRAVAADDLGF